MVQDRRATIEDIRIERIEWARLTGERPRKAGCNSRLGEHGLHVHPAIARLTTQDGASGFGTSWITPEGAEAVVGFRLGDAFDPARGVAEEFRVLEYPLWDLAGQLTQRPVHEMLSGEKGPFRVPCYDTSLYIDDLHLEENAVAAALIASEALEGKARGHEAFKIKVGRGAVHMPLDKGTKRDIDVVHAVREAVGPDAAILLDANNGYNLNLTRQVLGETASSNVYWMEEAFHEDARLYGLLKEWLNAEGLETRIADGEGDASPNLLSWAKDGLVDILQYDIFRPGFSPVARTGTRTGCIRRRHGAPSLRRPLRQLRLVPPRGESGSLRVRRMGSRHNSRPGRLRVLHIGRPRECSAKPRLRSESG